MPLFFPGQSRYAVAYSQYVRTLKHADKEVQKFMSHIVNANHLAVNPVDATRPLKEEWSRYGFVSTREVLNVFGAAGWKPVETTAIRARNPDRQGFQKHMVRLESEEYGYLPGLPEHNKSRPQLIFINSHDGTSSLKMMWGLIRFACLNGLISGEALQGVTVVHNMQILGRVQLAISEMLQGLPRFTEQVTALQKTQLSGAAVHKMVKTLYDARLAAVKNVQEVEYTLPLLRAQDDHLDAFTVFNRVQERMMRGGVQYVYGRQISDDTGKVVRVEPTKAATRPLNSVPAQLKLNQLAYDTALELV